jgi:Fe-S-cluster containining protein
MIVLEMQPGDRWVASASCVELQLDLPGGSLGGRCFFRNPDSTLADLVAPARELCDRVVDAMSDFWGCQGRHAACHKSCAACCRFLVPVSAPEALQMDRELGALPPARRSRVLQDVLASAKTILGRVEPALGRPEAPALEELSQWQKRLDVPCPLLRTDICSVYSRRPLACREHVTLVAAGLPHPVCGDESVQPARMPLSVASALGDLAADLDPAIPRAIFLAFWPLWVDQNRRLLNQTYPTADLLERLANLLQRQVRAYAAA